MSYDALLIVSFGGPEKPEDVMPFLENVTRGRPVPRERLLEVAGHYYHFGGRSPINDQNRALIAALRKLFAEQGPNLTIYWGNRNWHPLLSDTVREMRDNGVRRALAFVTSAFSSYSGCRQYRENILDAVAAAGRGAPEIDKLRVFYNHPGFIAAMAGRVEDALAQAPAAKLVFTAHSIPSPMAATSDYEAQLREAAALVAGAVRRDQWDLAYQSRSGPPAQPWLEPDILDWLRSFRKSGGQEVVIVPIGFISDHLEVRYDLDHEALSLAGSLGLRAIRAATAGTHPAFLAMIRDLVLERIDPATPKQYLGARGPRPDVCHEGCCPAPRAVSAIGRPES